MSSGTSDRNGGSTSRSSSLLEGFHDKTESVKQGFATGHPDLGLLRQVNDALVSGWSTGFLVGAAFLISAAAVATTMIRVSKVDAEKALHESAAVAG